MVPARRASSNSSACRSTHHATPRFMRDPTSDDDQSISFVAQDVDRTEVFRAPLHQTLGKDPTVPLELGSQPCADREEPVSGLLGAIERRPEHRGDIDGA